MKQRVTQLISELRGPGFLRCAGIILGLAMLAFCMPSLHAQTTATLSGAVHDPTGAVIPGATVTIVDQATGSTRVTQTDGAGVWAAPALLPGFYSVKAEAKGFAGKQITGIVLHAADEISIPAFVLAVGAASQTVTVQSASQILTTNNGMRAEVLTTQDIDNIALEGRDLSELLKVLPGVTNVTTGNIPTYNALNITAGQSAIGQGLNSNGAVQRGGTWLLIDGVSVLDVGADFSSLVTVNPSMTQEVSVLSTNFAADTQFGPVVISTISKSGSAQFHGEGYFDARNNVLDANDWLDNHQGVPQGPAHYYYPGGNIGGPVPFTHKKLFFWGGYERMLQNQGNSNRLESYIPSPEMMSGDFTNDNADNNVLCPSGFSSATQGTYWCNNLTNTILSDGTSPTVTPAGGTIPSAYVDPASKALSSFWPKANANPNDPNNPAGYNYIQPIVNLNNGWTYRLRVDYDLSDKTKAYISYQQGYSQELSQGNGAHIYWTPGNAIPFPGGGLFTTTFAKTISGHLVSILSPTMTNEFIAGWVWGNIPVGSPNPSAAWRSTLGYPNYPTVYNGGSKLIPSYSSDGTKSFPDFSQADIFEPSGTNYVVKKQSPQFQDNFTKVWGRHTVKVGAYAQNIDNLQGNDVVNLNGSIFFGGPANNLVSKVPLEGSYNAVANFITGNATGYSEANSEPVTDLAYQTLSFYINDAYRASSRLNLEVGFRFDHVGHWYDRNGVGIADFFPEKVVSDYYSGKPIPGYYWHGIDPGIPLSGQPDRFLFVSPRLGLSYDIFGTGRTLIRGGWGAYRFPSQYNDYQSGIITAQNIQTYSLPSQSSVLLSQLGNLTPRSAGPPPYGITGGQTGFDSTDYGFPVTYSYNMTVDQKLPGNFLLDVAYVGNASRQLPDSSESIEGGNYTGYANQNKTPIGGFFKADPVTGLVATNPENLGATCATPTLCNQSSDYKPYGLEYGTNTIQQVESVNYANYNGLQAAVLKRAGRLTINANFTWSKSLGTAANRNPFDNNLNYSYLSIDRPYVFSSSYVYRSGNYFHGNRFVGGAINGWTISGISSWQAGSNTGPGVSFQYDPTTLPAGITPSIGSNTYYGTDAGLTILPVLTCNPTAGLGYHQLFKACYAPPAVGQQGGQKFPYVRSAAFMENDLAVYKSFPIRGEQQVQFRVSAFNWLNHPLPTFSGSPQATTLYYLINYQTKAITLNTAPGTTNPSTFGILDSKTGAPSQRIMELNIQYSF